jgi:pimeloyl-[acyl-carrier protein] methyl ester esterase
VKRGTVILVSGWAHTASDMAPLASVLAQRFDVHTTSPGDLSSGASSYADALLSLTSGVEGPLLLAGWSMGAMIALEAVARLSLPAQKLVILSGTARFCADDGYTAGVPPQNLRALKAGLRRNPASALASFYRDVALPRALTAEASERKVADATAAGAAALDNGLQYLRDTDLRNTLDRIQIPVLALHGRQDCIVPWQAGEMLCKRLPCGTFVVYEKAGHDLLAADPDEVSSRIVEFLET